MAVNLAQNNPVGVVRVAAFRNALNELGWIERKNAQIGVRWSTDVDIRRNAASLVARRPDVVLANAPPSVMALLLVAAALGVIGGLSGQRKRRMGASRWPS
jgi:putative ABC transport system substrate-binding protein